MKTKLFKNVQKNLSNSLIEMSLDEQKNIFGGIRYIATKNPDGTIDYQIVHD